MFYNTPCNIIFSYKQPHGYSTSLAIMSASVLPWVFLALAGLDAETGIVMLIYLNNTYKERCSQGKMNTREDLYDAVIEVAVEKGYEDVVIKVMA